MVITGKERFSPVMKKIMGYKREFEVYAQEVLGLDNPYSSKSENGRYEYRVDGDTTIAVWAKTPMPSDDEFSEYFKTIEEKNRWDRLKERYVVYRILRELGYEALLVSPYRNYVKDPIPCFGSDRQCEVRCQFFGHTNCHKGAENSIHTLIENWGRQFNNFCPNGGKNNDV